MPYEIRRPMSDFRPDRWQFAATVSKHRTLSGAKRALWRQCQGAKGQGGYSQDVICKQSENGTWEPVTVEELDEDMSELSWR